MLLPSVAGGSSRGASLVGRHHVRGYRQTSNSSLPSVERIKVSQHGSIYSEVHYAGARPCSPECTLDGVTILFADVSLSYYHTLADGFGTIVNVMRLWGLQPHADAPCACKPGDAT